jgi:hypothetical protein
MNFKKKLPKGFKINPELDGKYHNDPAVLKKVEKAREILRVAGRPKGW